MRGVRRSSQGARAAARAYPGRSCPAPTTGSRRWRRTPPATSCPTTAPRPTATRCRGASCASSFTAARLAGSHPSPYDDRRTRRPVELAGVSDAHLQADHYDRVAGAVSPGDVAIGLSHSPEPRVVDCFAADGFTLVMAGHTHGGPAPGAAVRRAGHQLRARAPPGPRPVRLGAGAWLHVSAGLGTSPYAPVRFACPPEATLLTLTRARPVTAIWPLDSRRLRDVAQLGSAPRSGRGGRRFKSCHPDHLTAESVSSTTCDSPLCC